MSGSNQTTRPPNPSDQLINPDGTASLYFYQFLQTLVNRTGGGAGNMSYAYPYPTTTGTSGQKMTTSGQAGVAGTWETVNVPTKVSQLSNDTGYITSSALTKYETASQAKTDIAAGINGAASNGSPIMDGAASSGVSSQFSRSDHVHPNDQSKADISLFSGSASNPGYFVQPSGIICAFGSSVVALNANNAATISYGITFASSVFTFIVTNGDDSTNPGAFATVTGPYGLGTAVCTAVNPSSTTFTFNWIVYGI